MTYQIYGRCSWHSCSKHNLWRALVDGLIDFNNDEKVASKKPYLIQDQSTKTGHYFLPKWPKSIPHKAEKHTLWDIALIGEYPPPGFFRLDLPQPGCFSFAK